MSPRNSARTRLTHGVVQAASVAALIVALALLWRGQRACARAGGQYVRGLFGMECIRR